MTEVLLPTNPTLDPSAPPSDNFDLSRWYLSIQTDDNGDGKADSIKEDELNAGFEVADSFIRQMMVA